MVGFEEERERDQIGEVSLLNKLSNLPIYKRDTKTTRSYFFHFAQPNREENRAQGQREEERKSSREIERQRGGFAQGKEEQKAYKFKPFFQA